MGGETAQAIPLLALLTRQYPRSELVPQSLLRMGLLHQQREQIADAALVYQAFTARFPRHKEAQEALGVLGRIQAALGQLDQAEKTFRRYLKLYRKADDVRVIAIELGRLLEEQNKPSAQHYAATAKRFKKRDFVHLHIEALMGLARATKPKERARIYQVVVAADTETIHGGEAAFLLAERVREHYLALKLAPSRSTRELRKSLTAMTKGLQKADRAYQAVLKYKRSNWPGCAVGRIGGLYAHFASSLRAWKPPRGLSDDEADVYQQLLEDMILPIEEKAVVAFQTAIRQAHEARHYGECARYAIKSLDGLASGLIPGAPPKDRLSPQLDGRPWSRSLRMAEYVFTLRLLSDDKDAGVHLDMATRYLHEGKDADAARVLSWGVGKTERHFAPFVLLGLLHEEYRNASDARAMYEAALLDERLPHEDRAALEARLKRLPR